ncbi:uncharacterized protein KZ484_023380 isoform 2-T2 [Pholidichthys leucotaenia]
MISMFLTLLFFGVTPDLVCCLDIPVEILTVKLGDSMKLSCTYNCSIGFTRGCWHESSERSVCYGDVNQSSCTVSYNLSSISPEHLKKNYTCYTMNTDDPQLPQRKERIVLLQLPAHMTAINLTVATMPETKTASPVNKANDSNGGGFTGIKVLASVTVVVALVLAALAIYLCLNRHSWNGKGEPIVSRSSSPQPSHSTLSPNKGTQSAQSERVTLRIPPPDTESDTEVPYADIMITVRGVSTPELTQVGYVTAGEQKEWWGNEMRSHLQASRSADRLHAPQPREVSRKMSTNSEYAVITYA